MLHILYIPTQLIMICQGYIVVGYRGTFAFGRDMSDVKVVNQWWRLFDVCIMVTMFSDKDKGDKSEVNSAFEMVIHHSQMKMKVSFLKCFL